MQPWKLFTTASASTDAVAFCVSSAHPVTGHPQLPKIFPKGYAAAKIGINISLLRNG